MNQQDRDDLDDLLHHPGIKSLVEEIDQLVKNIESDIIKLSLDAASERELVYRKLRADGARRLYVAIAQRLLKPSPKRAKG